MDSGKYIIEIATSDYVTTQAAVEGGADRIELCANLVEGGTTPSLGHIRQCRKDFDIAIYPIIRPRGGDFLYNEAEFEIMKRDVRFCRESGCDGVVIGMLCADGSIDVPRVAKLVERAYPLEVTFHRAFDRCRDPFEALKQLINIGCGRILTSGQQLVAPDGLDLIARLNQEAHGDIVIMPGSGVRKENIRMLAEKTGCTEFHSSLRATAKSPMTFVHPAFANSNESYVNNKISPDEVRALRNALEG